MTMHQRPDSSDDGQDPGVHVSRGSNTNNFSCLYTKHKTQKRKVWQDGRLVLGGSSCRIYSADPAPGSGDPMIDQCELTMPEANSVRGGQRTDLETERYLITIDGPWRGVSSSSSNTSSNTPPSRGMSKLLKKKFINPQRKGPPPPPPTSKASVLGNRKRPLQPGELYNRYYGSQHNNHDPQNHTSNQSRPNAHYPQNHANAPTRANDHRNPNVALSPMRPNVNYPPPSRPNDYRPLHHDPSRTNPQYPPNHVSRANTSESTSPLTMAAFQKSPAQNEHHNATGAPAVGPPPNGTRHAPNHKRKMDTTFVQNNMFKESDFYEEEEEEEDSEAVGPPAQEEASQPQQDPQLPDDEGAPESFSLMETYQPPPRPKETLTSSQLMNLFSGKNDQFVLPDDSSSDDDSV